MCRPLTANVLGSEEVQCFGGLAHHDSCRRRTAAFRLADTFLAAPAVADVGTPSLFADCMEAQPAQILLYFVEGTARRNGCLEVGRKPLPVK